MNLASRRSVNLLKYAALSNRYSELSCESYLRNVPIGQSIIRNIHSNCRFVFLNRKVFQIFNRHFADYPTHKVITLPNLSPTMETGSVLSWGRKEGDAIAEGDLLAEIETDKATMSLDADDDGFVAKILIQAGTKDIPIGTPLCVVVEEEENVAAFKDFSAPSVAAPKAEAPASPPPPPPPLPSAKAAPAPSPTVAVAATAPGGRVVASPLARKLAAERGLSLVGLAGSGPGGRIIAADLDRAGSAPAIGQAAPAGLDTRDRAARAVASKREVPHYHLTVEVCVDRALSVCKQLTTDVGLSDFVIKAAALACRDVPQANSEWRGDVIRQYSSVDVSVSVDTENGLVSPVVHGAEKKGLLEINETLTNLAQKARENKLNPEEMQGGTFSVTNLGMLGVTNFNGIIIQPQSCLLAVGSTQQRLVADSASDKGYRSSSMLTATLCCDHRVVDGAVGAQWLRAFSGYLEEPTTMLL